MLTPRQAELLEYLRAQAADGRCPTFREMQKAMGFNNPAGVYHLLAGLEARGAIRRARRRARAIEVVAPSPTERGDAPPTLEHVPLAVLRAELARRGYALLRPVPAPASASTSIRHDVISPQKAVNP